VTRHLGDRTLAERTNPQVAEPVLTPAWVRDAGRDVPGVLLAWERRGGSWWGLVTWDPLRGRETVWIPAGRLQPIQQR